MSNHTIEQTKHSNGNIATEISSLNGKRDGLYIEYFPNGSIQTERTYEQGKVVAEKLFTIEGEIIKNIIIKDGRKYGLLFSSFCINGIASNPENDTLIFKSKTQ